MAADHDSQTPAPPPGLLPRLQRVSRATSGDEQLLVEAGPPGCGFYHEPAHHRIVCDVAELGVLGSDLLLAMVAGHEAGHAALTRYHSLVDGPAPPGAMMLLNALEDIRIEVWIGQRYPGLDGLLDALHEEFYQRHAQLMGSQPLVLQFAMAAIREAHTGALPDGLAAEVIEALERTRAAREAHARARPPVEEHSLPADLAARYTAPGVRERFGERAGTPLPAPFEMAVRLAALEAFEHVWDEVLPVYSELVMTDLQKGVDVTRLERRVMAQRPYRFRVVWGQRGPESEPRLAVIEPFRPYRSRHGEGDRAFVRVVWPPDGGLIYDRAFATVAPLIDALVDEFQPFYRDEPRASWATGFASGERLDLRRAQQAAADPSLRTTVFQRRLPQQLCPRPDPIVLLADLSGSMAEQAKCDSLLGGCVLLCEVFTRLGLPFALYGFHIELLEVLSFGQALDRGARIAIGELYLEAFGCRPGHEHDGQLTFTGPVLRELTGLLRPPAQIWVLSDGLPTVPYYDDDGEKASALLRSAIDEARRAGFQLVGLGLGPDTALMTDFFQPHAVAEIPLASLPGTLGSLTRRLLQPGART